MIVIFNWRYADTLRSSYHDSNVQCATIMVNNTLVCS